MYAHVNIWQLNEPGRSTDDTAAREIGTQLSKQPGFDTYTVVRTAEREVVVVTVFDTRDELDSAMHYVNERSTREGHRSTPSAAGIVARNSGYMRRISRLARTAQTRAFKQTERAGKVGL